MSEIVTEQTTLSRPRTPVAASRVVEPQLRIIAVHEERLRRRLARRFAAWAGLLLLAYWVAAFTLTHLPMRPGPGGLPYLDKAVHLSIFTGLSFLLSVWLGVRRRIGGAILVAGCVLVLLAAYATIDELSQIPVGRTADLLDWCADVTGISLGLLGFFGLRAWVRR